MEIDQGDLVLGGIPYTNIEDLADKYDIFILDVDGVIWEIYEEIPKSLEALKYLEGRGKKIFYYSNNSKFTQTDFISKLNSVGLPSANSRNVLNSTFLTGEYVKKAYPKAKNIYYLGSEGLKAELECRGLVVRGDEHNFKRDATNQEVEEFAVEDIDLVVAAMDKHINYYKICYASKCLIKNQIPFICANRDNNFLTGDLLIPGSGPTVTFLETTSGISPYVVGKPGVFGAEYILGQIEGMEKCRMIMVGDGVASDIAFGVNAGVDTCLVFTGVTTKDEVRNGGLSVEPTWIMDKLGTFKSL